MFRSQIAPVAALVMALAAVVPLGAEIFEQVLVKVNGEIITKTEFEQKQVAELRNRPELGNVSPNSPQLRNAIDHVDDEMEAIGQFGVRARLRGCLGGAGQRHGCKG